MKFFKRKSRSISKSPVIFKKKNESSRPKSKVRRVKDIFNIRRAKSPKGKSKMRGAGFSSTVAKSLSFGLKLFVPIVLIFIIYFGIRTVIQIRSDEVIEIDGVSFASGAVVGFDEIPVYPGSKFIFDEYMEEDAVKDLLTEGYSIYRLPPRESEDDSYEFYKEKLALLNWEHVLSVPRSDSSKKHGEYWVKDGEGLRIYSQLNDIWFNKISPSDARSGLADEVSAEIERDILLATTDGTELLPDIPWSLTVPKEYIVRYYPTQFTDISSIEISKIGASENILIVPVGANDSTPFDIYVESYVSELNKSDSEEDEKPKTWEVESSSYIELNGKNTLQSELTDGKTDITAYTFANNRDSMVYTFVTFSEDSQFFDYVVNNIVEKRSDYLSSPSF